MTAPNYDIEQAVAKLRTIEPSPVKAAEWIKAATLLAASGASPDLAAVVANIASRGRLCADDIAQLGRHQIDLRPALEAIRRQSVTAAPERNPESAPLQTRPAASAYLDRVRLFSHRPGPTLLTITAEWDDAEIAEWQAQDALEHKAAIEFPGWRKRRTIDGSTFSLRRLVVEFEPKEDR